MRRTHRCVTKIPWEALLGPVQWRAKVHVYTHRIQMSLLKSSKSYLPVQQFPIALPEATYTSHCVHVQLCRPSVPALSRVKIDTDPCRGSNMIEIDFSIHSRTDDFVIDKPKIVFHMQFPPSPSIPTQPAFRSKPNRADYLYAPVSLQYGVQFRFLGRRHRRGCKRYPRATTARTAKYQCASTHPIQEP
jgi:hypothetical protein